MKATIVREVLLTALKRAGEVAPRDAAVPILNNVLIAATKGKLWLTCTDMRRHVVATAEADVAFTGGVTVPVRLLTALIDKLPEGASVVLEHDGDKAPLKIGSGRVKVILNTMPAGEMPDFKPDDSAGGHHFTLPASALLRIVDRTVFAASHSADRANLQGVYLHVAARDGRKVLRAVATDGQRLALAECDLPKDADAMPGIIVSTDTATSILRLLKDMEGDIAVDLSARSLRIEAGPIILTALNLDASYPDYERVIPRDGDKVMTVDRAAFERAVDRVGTICNQTGRAVKASVDKQRLVLQASSADNATAEETVEIEFTGPSIDIGFNSRLMQDIAARVTGEQLVIRMSKPDCPALIGADGVTDESYVLMPMRI